MISFEYCSGSFPVFLYFLTFRRLAGAHELSIPQILNERREENTTCSRSKKTSKTGGSGK